jgi:vitamin B12 transporter
MNNPYLSGYNFGQLSTAGVEKIEIIRGPYSALYGSEAVSGVVNVLSTPAQSRLNVDVTGGGNALKNGAASGAIVSGIWTVHGAVEHRDDDGFAPNDDFASDTVVAGVQAVPQPNLSLGLLARHNRYDLGIPRNVNSTFTAFVPTLHRREKGSESQIALPIRLDAGGVRYDLRLADSERNEKFGDPDAPFGAEFGNTDASSRTARLTAQSRRTVAGVITIGGEMERASVDHTDSFGLDVRHRSRDSRSFFAEDRFSKQLGKGAVELALGARYDHFDTFGSQVSPRVAVAWVAGRSKWRAAFGEGFRAPAIGELYAPFFGNPQLDAERSRNVEIGFDRYIRQATISLTAFRSDYDDLITYDVVANRFGNIARASAHGVEVSASRRLGKFSGAFSYTWLKAIDAATNEQLVRRPQNSGSLSLGYDFDAVSAEVVAVHAGKRPDVTDLAPFGAVMNAAYTTADVTLRYNAGTFTPFVKLENATNKRYDEVFGYPSATRRLIAGIRYSLQ